MQLPTRDRGTWGRSIFVAGALMLALAFILRPYVWVRLPHAMVSVEGQPSPPAAVYRSHSGELLVWIQVPNGGPFVIVPSEGWVARPNGSALLDDNPDQGHWLVTKLFVVSRDRHPRGVSLTSAYFDIDPRLVFKPGRVEFTQEIGSPASSSGCCCRVCVRF